MQTDIWLAEDIDYSERCPLCSQPLKNGSTTCFFCGFSTKSQTGTSVWIDPAVYGFPHSTSQRQSPHLSSERRQKYARELQQVRRHSNPSTPIPPRASAQPSNATPGSIVKLQRSQKKTTSTLEMQQRAHNKGTPDLAFEISSQPETPKDLTVWEYETPAFQASSSLSTLSLLVSEKPTQPELNAQGKVTRRLPGIDEISTVPPQNTNLSINASQSLVPINSQPNVTPFLAPDRTNTQTLLSQEVEAFSWTAGKASESSHARLISSRSRRRRLNKAVSLNPIDRLRWWLLRPGHIEFVLWLGGTVLLVAVTCVLLFVTAFSFEWITPRFISQGSNNTSGTSTISEQQTTVVATTKMVLIRVDKGPILPGQSIELRGEGFSPLGHVRFLFDGTLPLYDQNGQSTSTQANSQGKFATSIVLDTNLPWRPGPHFINAQDLVTKRLAKLTIFLSPAPIGKGMPNTPVPSYPSSPSGVTPPALTPIAGGQPTPVGQPPVPITPTPHPGTPTPTPTVGKTPTVTPTVGISPTVSPTMGKTPGVTTTAGATVGSGLSNALDDTGDSYLAKQLVHLNPLVWVMIACYCLSMVLLGLAGVLHKRHQ